MYTSLTISLLVHGILLGWALISFHATPPIKTPEIRPVEVAIISPDDLIRLRKGDRNSKKLETKKAKSPKKSKKNKKNVRKQPTRAAQPLPEPLPPTERKKTTSKKKTSPKTDEIAAKIDALTQKTNTVPKPTKSSQEEKTRRKLEAEQKRAIQQKKKAVAKRKAKKLAEKKRKERARKRAEKKRRERERKRRKKQFDPVKLAALLNKIPDLPKPPSGAINTPKDASLPKGPRAGAEEGRDARLTASQRSLLAVMMKRAVSECWRVQTGMAGADRLVVEVEIKLHESGNLKGEPRVVNRHPDSAFRDAATNAVRALKQCGPYDLPRELYKGGWDHMVVTFDPQRMF
ncbi:MAG: hypothetical protein ACR2PG_12050 [Hyphomicrobiaceae bacterium]